MTSGGLYRIAAANIIYAIIAGAFIWYGLRRESTTPDSVDTAICCLPALLCLLLAFTSNEDPEQYVVRLMACLFGPVLLLLWSGGSMAYTLGIGALHLLLFAGSVLWIGTTVTRVPAVGGVAAVDASNRPARLVSTGAMGALLRTSSRAANEIVVTFAHRAADRSCRVLLNLDPDTRQVRVREPPSVNMAGPVNENEESLPGPGIRASIPRGQRRRPSRRRWHR
jgi:hypothetical protein